MALMPGFRDRVELIAGARKTCPAFLVMPPRRRRVIAGLDGGDPVVYRPRVGLDRDGGKEAAAG
jgi:hypothetical protein